jgi:hypothetical protein
MIFIADLIACSTCFGHHYAHHQELESIIQKVAAWLYVRFADRSPQTGHITNSSTSYRNLKTKAPNITGSNLLYNTLEFLMMGIMVLETCWASNKICNKKHLLHLVGILFPHINDDARSKSLHINLWRFLAVQSVLFNLMSVSQTPKSRFSFTASIMYSVLPSTGQLLP